MRITHCAAEPRLAMEVMVDATFDRARAVRAARGHARWSRPRRPRSTGWPSTSRPTERHHPYDNRTLYGAAKLFNEGLLRSFNDMHGLDYVALRYFNVYGPRMDIHGAYTEVLIRWMERIAAGQPPLIFGDGTQTMDFVHVARHRPRQHPGGRVRRSPTRSSTSASGTETSLLDLAPRARCGDRTPDLTPEFTAGAGGQPGAAPAGRRADARARSSAFGAEISLRTGLARAGRSGGAARRARCGRMTAGGRRHDPDRQARAGRGRGRAAARGRPVRAGSRRAPRSRPSSRSSPPTSARRTPAPSPTARRRCTWRSLAVGVGPGDEVDHRQPLVHRHRQRHPLLRRDAGVRRHRAGHLQHGSRRGSRRRSRRAPGRSCACTRSACRATSTAILAIARRHGLPRDRGRRLRHRQRDLLATASGSGSAGRTATSPASPSIRAR